MKTTRMLSLRGTNAEAIHEIPSLCSERRITALASLTCNDMVYFLSNN